MHKRVLVLFLGFFIGPALAEPDTMLSFNPGHGSEQFAMAVTPHGTLSGPMGILPSGMGLMALDGGNHRLIRINEQGISKGIIPLPPGEYRHLARDSKGHFWLIEEKSRIVLKIAEGIVKKIFTLPSGDGSPQNLDALACRDEQLIIGDFDAREMYFFSHQGKLDGKAEWRTALSLVTDDQGKIHFLTPSTKDLYGWVTTVLPNGTCLGRPIKGNALSGARLLGILPDGRGVGFGIRSASPFAQEVFVIEATGSCTTIDTITHPFQYAVRYGGVSGYTVWLNSSRVDQEKIMLYRYTIPPLSFKPSLLR